MLRKGCNQESDRFDNMSEVAEFWHAKQAFLSVSLCSYKNEKHNFSNFLLLELGKVE